MFYPENGGICVPGLSIQELASLYGKTWGSKNLVKLYKFMQMVLLVQHGVCVAGGWGFVQRLARSFPKIHNWVRMLRF